MGDAVVTGDLYGIGDIEVKSIFTRGWAGAGSSSKRNLGGGLNNLVDIEVVKMFLVVASIVVLIVVVVVEVVVVVVVAGLTDWRNCCNKARTSALLVVCCTLGGEVVCCCCCFLNCSNSNNLGLIVECCGIFLAVEVVVRVVVVVDVVFFCAFKMFIISDLMVPWGKLGFTVDVLNRDLNFSTER